MRQKSEAELLQTSLMLANLMPIFAVKFIKYAERKLKDQFSPLQMHTLFTLSCEGQLSMSELAKQILVSKQQLTPIIDKLIDLELAIREHDLKDRRNVTIRLSEKGHAFIDDRRHDLAVMISELIQPLPDSDIDALNRSAQEITSVLNKLP